jgi:hypothetical protein
MRRQVYLCAGRFIVRRQVVVRRQVCCAQAGCCALAGLLYAGRFYFAQAGCAQSDLVRALRDAVPH